MSQKIKVLDLFAGCGGLSYGFMSNGSFSIEVANELVPIIGKTYAKNHPETFLVVGDICDKEIRD